MLGSLKRKMTNAINKAIHPDREERSRLEKELMDINFQFVEITKLESIWRTHNRTGDLRDEQMVRVDYILI